MSSNNINNFAKLPTPTSSQESDSDHGETCKFNSFEVIDNEVSNYLMITQPCTPDFYKLTQNSTNHHNKKVIPPPPKNFPFGHLKPSAKKKNNQEWAMVHQHVKSCKVGSYTTKNGTKVQGHKRAHKNTKSTIPPTKRIKRAPYSTDDEKASYYLAWQLYYQDRIKLVRGNTKNN